MNAVRDVTRQVWSLALPAMGQGFLHTLVFLVDRAMLGRYDADALAAMQIGGPLVWAAFSTLFALNVGAVALVGRAIGAGDPALATSTARGALGLAVGVGLMAAIAGTLLIEPLLLLFPEAGHSVHGEARGYLWAVLPALPFVLVSLTCSATMAAAGNTRTPFLVAALGNSINIGANVILIFGWGAIPALGAAGAGLGSSLAMVVQASVLILWLLRPNRVISLRGKGGEREALRRVLKISFPAVAERVVQHLGFYGFVVMVGLLGSTAMAANQSLVSLESIAFMTADGVGIAAAAVVAQNLGAGRRTRARLGGLLSVALSVALLSLVAVLFVVVPETLVRAFSDDPDIIKKGVRCLYIAAIAQPFMGASIVLAQALRGAGETRLPFVTMLICGFGVRLIATWYFAFELDYGLVGVWVGSTVDWVARSIILGVSFLRGRWQLREV